MAAPANLRARVADSLLDRGALVALVVLVAYLWLAPGHVVDGDNAEMSTLGALGGVAHPPGYPLYVLYLRALSWLPGSSAAHTAALATAILGAAAVLVLHAACRAWGARPGAASFAAAVFAGAPVVLRLHTEAEVFAANDLIVALVLWLSAAAGPLRGRRRAVALGLVAGLGLCVHHTAVLIAPVGLLGAVRGVRETSRGRAATMGLAIAALAVGLAPYAYDLVAARSAVSWGHPESIGDLVRLFTRTDYGGAGAFSVVQGDIRVGANLAALAHTVGRSWLWLPALIGVGTLAVRTVRRSGSGESRWAWGLLAASTVVAGPVLVMRFNIVPEGVGLAICQRFHLLPVLLLAIPVAVGVTTLAQRFAIPSPRRRAVREALMVTVFVAAAGLALPHQLAIHSPAVETGIVNILSSLPEHAVVMSTSDDLHFGALYAQDIRGVRTDVAVIAWPMMNLPWYVDQVAARGLALDPHAAGEGAYSVRVARQIFATGRPLFVEITLGNVLGAFQSYPHGALLRVLPPGSAMPSLDELVAINQRVYAAFDLAYPRPDAGAAYAAEMHARYARTWEILAGALAQARRPDDARAAREVAASLAPEP